MEVKKIRRAAGLIALCCLALFALIFAVGCSSGKELQATVTFMDGDTVVETVSVVKGSVPDVPEVEEREGYALEWIREDGAIFRRGDKVDEDVTLYLHAVPVEYSVTYDARGGVLPEGNPTSFTVESEETTLLFPHRDGAVFCGWLSRDGKSVKSLPYGAGDLTLYAYWTPELYSITYLPEGGTLPEENPKDYTVDEPYTLNEPTRNGYKFLGWYDEEGERVASLEGQLGDLVLTARWEPVKYVITYVLEGGENGEGNPSFCDVTADVTFAAPSRYGYTFLGWRLDDEDELRKSYVRYNGSVGDFTLTAVWEPVTVTVKLVCDGAVIRTAEVSFDGELTELDVRKKGYRESLFSDEALTEKVTLPIRITSTEQTVYVGYELIEYEIMLDYGEGEVLFRTYNVESEGFFLPLPEREGYEFLGWKFRGLNIVMEAVFISKGSNGSKSLVAVWEPKSYALTFVTNGGGALPKQTVDCGEALDLPTPKQSGKVFEGWFTDEECTIPFEETVMPPRSVTLYAKWSAEGEESEP